MTKVVKQSLKTSSHKTKKSLKRVSISLTTFLSQLHSSKVQPSSITPSRKLVML